MILRRLTLLTGLTRLQVIVDSSSEVTSDMASSSTGRFYTTNIVLNGNFIDNISQKACEFWTVALDDWSVK